MPKIIIVILYVCVFVHVRRLQVFLNTYGIQTQTPQQVEPIQIWPQKELVKVTQTHTPDFTTLIIPQVMSLGKSLQVNVRGLNRNAKVTLNSGTTVSSGLIDSCSGYVRLAFG